MMGTLSVSMLLQSFNLKDHSPRASFEHRIVLYHFEEELTKQDLITFIKAENTESSYETATHEIVYWKVVKVLDVFEVDDKVEFQGTCEVYSRFFIEDHLSEEIILENYFSDYLFEEQ